MNDCQKIQCEVINLKDYSTIQLKIYKKVKSENYSQEKYYFTEKSNSVQKESENQKFIYKPYILSNGRKKKLEMGSFILHMKDHNSLLIFASENLNSESHFILNKTEDDHMEKTIF